MKVETGGIWEAARFAGDGYDRMEVVSRAGWRPLSSWGADGWDLGDWPYVVVYVRERDGVYDLAVNVEGDTDEETFATRERRAERLNEIAEFYWRHNGNGPSEADRAAGKHRGPYRAS